MGREYQKYETKLRLWVQEESRLEAAKEANIEFSGLF
jgi:hypothetical protein